MASAAECPRIPLRSTLGTSGFWLRDPATLDLDRTPLRPQNGAAFVVAGTEGTGRATRPSSTSTSTRPTSSVTPSDPRSQAHPLGGCPYWALPSPATAWSTARPSGSPSDRGDEAGGCGGRWRAPPLPLVFAPSFWSSSGVPILDPSNGKGLRLSTDMDHGPRGGAGGLPQYGQRPPTRRPSRRSDGSTATVAPPRPDDPRSPLRSHLRPSSARSWAESPRTRGADGSAATRGFHPPRTGRAELPL